MVALRLSRMKPANSEMVRSLVRVALLVGEAIVILLISLWVVVGMVRYAIDTRCTLKGLLTMLDEHWRGALILAGILFYRTLQELIARSRRFHAEFDPVIPLSDEPKPVEGSPKIEPTERTS